VSGDSTELDPAVRSQESLEFEFALRNKVVGPGGSCPRSLMWMLSNEDE
jgi:hypothetical protein